MNSVIVPSNFQFNLFMQKYSQPHSKIKDIVRIVTLKVGNSAVKLS